MNGGHNIVVTVQITELTTQENSLKKKPIKKLTFSGNKYYRSTRDPWRRLPALIVEPLRVNCLHLSLQNHWPAAVIHSTEPAMKHSTVHYLQASIWVLVSLSDKRRHTEMPDGGLKFCWRQVARTNNTRGIIIFKDWHGRLRKRGLEKE